MDIGYLIHAGPLTSERKCYGNNQRKYQYMVKKILKDTIKETAKETSKKQSKNQLKKQPSLEGGGWWSAFEIRGSECLKQYWQRCAMVRKQLHGRKMHTSWQRCDMVRK